MDKTVPGSHGTSDFIKLLTASAGGSVDLTAKPTFGGSDGKQGIDSPAIVLRAFLRNTSTNGSADGSSAAFSVIGWKRDFDRGILLANVTVLGGAGFNTGSPFRNVTDAYRWHEADSFVFTEGVSRPEVRSAADKNALMYLDLQESFAISAVCTAVDANTELMVGFQSASTIPPAAEVPFEVAAGSAGGAFSDQDFGLSVPGSGQEYLIHQMDVTLGAALSVTLHTGAGGTNPIWGAHTLPAGFTPLIFAQPLRVGNNLIPLCTIAAFTGRVTLRGVRRPVGLH